MANSESTIRPFPAQGRAAQIPHPKRVALYAQKEGCYMRSNNRVRLTEL